MVMTEGYKRVQGVQRGVEVSSFSILHYTFFMGDYSKETTDLIIKDFELELKEEPVSEQEMLDVLADHVAYLLEHRLEFVMSLLYRLDVDERLVEEVLMPGAPIPANIGIARLIIERQKQRVHTKKNYKPPKIDDWEDF